MCRKVNLCDLDQVHSSSPMTVAVSILIMQRGKVISIFLYTQCKYSTLTLISQCWRSNLKLICGM